MTDREKFALEKAFDIPEPQHKKQFTERFRELEKQQRRKPVFPVFMKFASTAAMCAFILGTWMNIKDNTKPDQNIDQNIIIAEESSIDEYEDKDDEMIVTDVTTSSEKTTSAKSSTTSDGNKKSNTTTTASSEKNVNSKTTSKKSENGVNTTSSSSDVQSTASESSSNQQKSDENNTTASQSKEKTTEKTTSKTTSKTTPTKTTTKTTSKETMTTTTKIMQNNQQTDGGGGMAGGGGIMPNNPVGRDRTIDTGVRYYPNGNVIDRSSLDDEKGGRDNTVLPPTSGPVSPPDSLDIIRYSDAAFTGVVSDVIYTSINGTSYIQLNIEVISGIRGMVSDGDRVSVFCEGGYMPAKEYLQMIGKDMEISDDVLVDMNNEDSYVPDIGSAYAFFVRDASSYIAYDAYLLSGSGAESIFRTDGYRCYDKNNSYQFTIDDIYNY